MLTYAKGLEVVRVSAARQVVVAGCCLYPEPRITLNTTTL